MVPSPKAAKPLFEQQSVQDTLSRAEELENAAKLELTITSETDIRYEDKKISLGEQPKGSVVSEMTYDKETKKVLKLYFRAPREDEK